MSWGWEVSLIFVLIQVLSIVYLFGRNAYIDRWYCLLILPFLGQQIIQFFQWGFGDIENATTTECTSFNRTFSKFLIVTVYLIPVCISIFSFATSQYHPKEQSITISWMWKWLMIKDINLFGILSILCMIDNECVTVGKNGQQNWHALLIPNIIENGTDYEFAYFLVAIFFYPTFILAATLYKPLWIVWLPIMYAIVCLIILCIFLGQEAWSVWCWACVFMNIWYFVYNYVSNRMINKHKIQQQLKLQLHNDQHENDEKVQDEANEEKSYSGKCSCICKFFSAVFAYVHNICFDRTEQHFVRYRLMNDKPKKFGGGIRFKL